MLLLISTVNRILNIQAGGRKYKIIFGIVDHKISPIVDTIQMLIIYIRTFTSIKHSIRTFIFIKYSIRNI